MLARSDITIDRSNWPVFLLNAEAAIEALLEPAWDLNVETYREISHNVTGLTNNQLRLLDRLLDVYRLIGGWTITTTNTDATTWTVRFALNGSP